MSIPIKEASKIINIIVQSLNVPSNKNIKLVILDKYYECNLCEKSTPHYAKLDCEHIICTHCLDNLSDNHTYKDFEPIHVLFTCPFCKKYVTNFEYI